jgi:hypothetical protein
MDSEAATSYLASLELLSDRFFKFDIISLCKLQKPRTFLLYSRQGFVPRDQSPATLYHYFPAPGSVPGSALFVEAVR